MFVLRIKVFKNGLKKTMFIVIGQFLQIINFDTLILIIEHFDTHK